MGLPPLLLQVAENEPMRDDSIQFHKRALAAGVDSRLEVFDNAFHDFRFHPASRGASCDRQNCGFLELYLDFSRQPLWRLFESSPIWGILSVRWSAITNARAAPACVVANFIRHFFP